MKFQLALLLTACASVASISEAVECTQAQLASFKAAGVDTEFAKACSKVLGGTAPTSLNAATFLTLNPCGDAACTAFLEKLGGQLPDCDIMGLGLKSTFSMILGRCSGANDAATTTTAPMPSASASSTDGSSVGQDGNSTMTTQPPSGSTSDSVGSSTPPTATVPAPTNSGAGTIQTAGIALAAAATAWAAVV